jgi:hypothetical protein
LNNPEGFVEEIMEELEVIDPVSRAGKSTKMSKRGLLLGVKCPQSCVEDILQKWQLYLIFSLKSSFCASFLPSNKDLNPNSSIFTSNHHTNL